MSTAAGLFPGFSSPGTVSGTFKYFRMCNLQSKSSYRANRFGSYLSMFQATRFSKGNKKVFRIFAYFMGYKGLKTRRNVFHR